MSLKPTSNETAQTPLGRAGRRLVWPVWNLAEGRLRAPIRALAPLVVTFLGLAAIQEFVRPRVDGKLLTGTVESSLLGLTLAAAVFLGALLVDRRPVTEYGFALDREWARSFAVGGVIATAVNAGTALVAVGAGWATVEGVAQGTGELPFFVGFLLVFGYIAVAATWEEFIFRGAMLKNVAEGTDGYVPRWAAVGVAVLVSTAVFAFMHSGKLTHPSQAGYYVLAGLIFGGVYVLTGDLALPVGFHVFYNFSMSAVFGLGVSQRTPELLALDIVGPALWIGEEGLLRVFFAAVGGVVLIAYIRWRDGPLGLSERVTRWTPRHRHS